jgi:hypothetical protein
VYFKSIESYQSASSAEFEEFSIFCYQCITTGLQNKFFAVPSFEHVPIQPLQSMVDTMVALQNPVGTMVAPVLFNNVDTSTAAATMSTTVAVAEQYDQRYPITDKAQNNEITPIKEEVNEEVKGIVKETAEWLNKDIDEYLGFDNAEDRASSEHLQYCHVCKDEKMMHGLYGNVKINHVKIESCSRINS